MRLKGYFHVLTRTEKLEFLGLLHETAEQFYFCSGSRWFVLPSGLTCLTCAELFILDYSLR